MPNKKKIKSGTLAIFKDKFSYINTCFPDNKRDYLLPFENDVILAKKEVLVVSKKSCKKWNKWISYCWVLAVNKKDNTQIYGWVETRKLKPLVT